MPVLDHTALEQSPLADLHTLASELSIDSYRRLRRAELIDAILGRQSGEEPSPTPDGQAALPTEEASAGAEDPAPKRRRRAAPRAEESAAGVEDAPPKRRRRAAASADSPADAEADPSTAEDVAPTAADSAPKRRRRAAPRAEESAAGVEDAPPKRRRRAAASAEGSPADVKAVASTIEDAAPKRRRRATPGAQAASPEAEAPVQRPAASAPADVGGPGDRAVDATRGADTEEEATRPRRRGRRAGRGRGAQEESPQAKTSAEDESQIAADRAAGTVAKAVGDRTADTEITEQSVEGVVELLAGGSGFVRVDPPEPSDDDVYISAAQVKRCELVSGDRIAGPRRAPRRSERFASLVRVDTINGRPATEVADGVRFDDLPAAFPADRFRLGSEDPTVKAIEWLTPIGRGSRVTIVGGARAGKSEALRRLALALVDQKGLEVTLALAGVRPEEISEWTGSSVVPAAAVSFAASADAQGQIVERVVDQARRVASRGGDALVLVDTIDGLSPHLARKTLASARKLVDGGSLTVIATASAPVGGETTVIALDAMLASVGRFPALDLVASGTMRPELLVGDAGAEAIARARAQALDS
ncbi:MAG: Rho termination factor N-terminal domain-containing protein [Solirubrobacteraceae bacterium]